MIERRKRKVEDRRDKVREGEMRKSEREVKGIERVKGAQRKILVKSPEPGNKAQRNSEYKNYHAITMRRNYELVYQSRGKCEIYRDTGVSKKQEHTSTTSTGNTNLQHITNNEYLAI